MLTEEQVKDEIKQLQAQARGIKKFIDDLEGDQEAQATNTYNEALVDIVIINTKINTLKRVLG